MNTPADASHRPSLARLAVAVLLCLLSGWLAFALYTTHNDYPEHYHWDEPSKIDQILNGRTTWNFNHPLLLLESADLIWQRQRTAQATLGESRPASYGQRLEVAVAGRTASAALAAVGVAAVALTGYLVHGFAGLLLSALGVMLCAPLLVYAHNFKEDAALASGIMLCLPALWWVLSAQSHRGRLLSAAALGAGCAMAASGKYVGAVMVLPSLLAFALSPERRWPERATQVAVFTGVLVAVLLLINQAAFSDGVPWRPSAAAGAGLQRELQHSLNGHFGLSLGAGNVYALRVASTEIPWSMWLLGGLGLAWALWARQRSRWGTLLAVTLVVWIAALSLNTIPFPRYSLPISLLCCFLLAQLASAAIAGLKRSPRVRAAALVAAAGLTVAVQLPLALRLNQQVLHDSRQAMHEWVMAHLPAGAPVLAEQSTSLASGGDVRRHPSQPSSHQPPHIVPFAQERSVRTAAEAAQRGYDYVAVTGSSYERFYLPEISYKGRPVEQHPLRRFYDDLFAHGELVWSFQPDSALSLPVNPALRLYRVAHLRSPR